MSVAEEIAKNARYASTILKAAERGAREEALSRIWEELKSAKEAILEANAQDMRDAEVLLLERKLSASIVKRLDLSRPGKYDDMLQGIQDVLRLEDPVGKITLARHLDYDLELYRVSCPVGVLLVIFEARPEVIANITALAIKSGNAVILKGGKESARSFRAISHAISTALSNTKIPTNAVQLVASREEVSALLAQDRYIDMVIPRGSNALVRSIKDNTKIPVLGHADGLCSIYLHEDAPAELAAKVVLDSKIGYPAACNAVETLLVHEKAITSVLPCVSQALADANVQLRCDDQCLSALSSMNVNATRADDADYDTEFLDLVLAVKTVKNVQEAIQHINEHGSGHTDCIITNSEETSRQFMAGVDSAGTFWNCSTRFADGFRYGFGAEVGISTNKIHARGPVGLDGIMIYQYQVKGNGNIVADYTSGRRKFLHTDILT